MGITFTGVILGLDTSGAMLARGLALLAVLAAAYAALGWPAARTGSARLAHAYLVVLCLVTAASAANAPISVILLFVAFSQIWFFGPSRTVGVIYSLALSVLVFGGLAWVAGLTATDIRDAAVQAGFAAGFAILLGLWITYIAEQSEVRGELLDELRATRDELARTSHDSGVMAERERMAGEIHDTLAQGFASIVMLTQTAQAELARDEADRAAGRLELIEATARENLAEARALVAAFAPVGLSGATLVEALERLAARFTTETGVEVVVQLPPETTALSREHEVVILRVAQEALTNVRRHADAGAARVGLTVSDDGAAVLEVLDDGRGIDPARAEGFGLRGMRERVTATGGTLEVDAPATGGTLVRVRLGHAPTTEASP
ncbi:MAG: sensor histidine kinase [Actinomycetales bacterium]|nr:sensor histidine kinase [Actinomycetales bacterium]